MSNKENMWSSRLIMLSKKKDSSGINDGIAGKYVKRDTPPMLRSKYLFKTPALPLF